VFELAGLSEPAEANILRWADTTFTVFGPMNERSTAALPALARCTNGSRRSAEDLAPGSMGRAIFAAADAGKIATESCRPLITAYITAGIDTTINSISSAVHLFATHPTQWDLVRAPCPEKQHALMTAQGSGGSRHPTQRRCVTLTYGAVVRRRPRRRWSRWDRSAWLRAGVDHNRIGSFSQSRELILV